MNRPLLAFAFFAAATAALAAQEASQSSPYSGVSNPPPDDTIITNSQEQAPAKPPASHPAAQQVTQQAAPVQQSYAAPAPVPAQPAPAMGSDDGIVQVAPPASAMSTPQLANRAYAADPDGDIVHPAPLGPGELREGTEIRVRLMNGVSSAYSEQGEQFRARVASDVYGDGSDVLIPAGSEITGRVATVSTGSFGKHGSIVLRPESVTLPNGESFRLHAMVASAPATHTRVDGEGVIGPDSRKKRDAIEYGGAVGAGLVAGAYIGGPAGALAGGLVGAGLVTVHLLVSHPQAHLEEGDVLMLTLTDRMHLVPTGTRGE